MAALALAAQDSAAGDDAQVEAASASDAGDLRDAVPQGALETVPVVSGMSLRLTAPREWMSTKQIDTSFIDLSGLTGARVVLARSWVAPKPGTPETGRVYADSMLLVCVEAPAAEWAPGMEDLVFDRMNQMAREELSRHASLDNFDAAPPHHLETHYKQTFKAHGELGEGHSKGQVRELHEDRPDRPHNHARNVGAHILTVPAGTQQMVACTLSCGETERPDQKSFACDASVASFEPLGDLSSEPSVTTLGKFLVGIRRHPLSGVGIVLGLVMIVAGIALATRALMHQLSRPAA